MRGLRAWIIRFGNLFRKSRHEQDLSEELDSNLQFHIEDNLRAGMSPAEARRDALLKMGGMDLVKEQYRDRRGIPMLETTLQDLRYALRTMRANPGFALTAVLTLGLGIGTNSAMFSFVDGTTFRPPDIPNPGELVRVFTSSQAEPYSQVSYPDYLEYRSRNQSLSGLTGYTPALLPMSRNRNETPELLGAWAVDANFFSLLDVDMPLGRGFLEEEGRVNEVVPVAVVSHRLWERYFQSDPDVIGEHVTLMGHDFTIVGVTPERFLGTELFVHPDLYVPLSMVRELTATAGAETEILANRSERWLNVLGRLNGATTLQEANAEFAAIAKFLQETYPDTNQTTALVVPEVTARERLEPGSARIAWISLVLVGLVLLIACVNVANLMLSRATARTREIAVRLAVGASRTRIIRQLLTESLLLAIAGGGAGLLLAYGCIRYISTIEIAPSVLPIYWDIRLDARVLFFTFAVSILTAALFGLMPALQSTRLDLISALKSSMKTFRGRLRWFGLRNVLVASQVAMSTLVLITAGFAIESFDRMLRTDPGFRTDGVLLMSFNPGLLRYNEEQSRNFYNQLLERTRSLPGVESAGLTAFVPLGVMGTSISLVIDGYEMPAGQDRIVEAANIVDPGFWSVMGIEIMRGRAFDERDTRSSRKAVIVNEMMAARYWPNQDALGRVVRLEDEGGSEAEVIGIARDGKYRGAPLMFPSHPFVFVPFSQSYRAGMTLMVFTRRAPADLAGAIRTQAQAVDPAVPVFDVRTMNELFMGRGMRPTRTSAQITTTLGVLGIVLSVIGLYGVTAYLVARRTREIGIRMAIGARRATVLFMFLKQAAGVVAVGLTIGLALAYVVPPSFLSISDDVNPRDSRIFTIVTAIIAVATLLAALVPALRAARIDPMVALRDE